MGKRQEIEISTAEAKRQMDIISQLAHHIQGKNLKFCITTFGCQMNAHDSEKIQGMLSKMGYSETDKEAEADLILYNTCCVRENAENRIYGKLGYLKKLKRANPNLLIALCGCMMQQDIVLETLKKTYRHVDMIFGTYNIYKLPELLQTRFETGKPVIDIWDSHQDIVEDLPNERKYPFKSCVNIMYGCNNFCTYCIVPYVRGRERSRNPEDILKEIHALVEDGVKEIMLLGQNVNSYGKTLDIPMTFADLIREVNKIEGLERLRFMTSHPKDLSDDLILAMSECDKLCNSLHLPFQAGSTDVLTRMNRRYTKEQYLALVSKVKATMPHIALTTDIIIGFPGETEEDFQETMDVVRQVRFASAFTFVYSKRTGTPAATMDNQIEEVVSKDRFNRLLDLVHEIQVDYMESFIGHHTDVLLEEVSKHDPNLLSGRTSESVLVHVKADPSEIGKIVDIKITGAKTHYLIGECL
ncbi:tRNA (N6-isopentenyl adenosine(37)-C2)-methylthiotransferase MiaB [Niameybacter sp.]|uniref:tRNA (N6-isopentenyl adenosine(37)-C2)-methylthiotransferase MiaB n=1 Tax=Niameybacter sp. TaxID=2033640 RepID=UPI002FC9F4D8